MASEDWLNDDRAIQRVRVYRDAAIDEGTWPMTVPAVAGFVDIAAADGWEFAPGVAFLMGENGSGKSTLVEGIAEAYGLPPEGGSNHGGVRPRRSESPLGEWLRIERSPLAPRWGFFLRSETMHGYYTFLEGLPDDPGPRFHEFSHGESFNALLDEK